MLVDAQVPRRFDFCYWANAALLLYVWIRPSDANLFQICFIAANGPLVLSYTPKSTFISAIARLMVPLSGMVDNCLQQCGCPSQMAAHHQRVHPSCTYGSHLRTEMVQPPPLPVVSPFAYADISTASSQF